MKKAIIALVIILAGINIFAADVQFMSGSDVIGKYLSLEIGARSSSLGDADSALCSGPEAIFINPANTRAQDADNSLLISHDSWLGDVFEETAAYVHNFQKYGVGGIGISYLNEGKIDGYTVDTSGNPVATGSINPYALVIKANWSNYMVKQFEAGINIGFAQEDIGGYLTHKGMIDLGIKYEDIVKGLSLGMALENYGLAVNGYSMDTNLLIGLGYVLTMQKAGDLNTELDVKIPYKNNALIAAGIEYIYDRIFFVRVGYEGDNSDVTGLKGLRMGLGLKYEKFNIDYCLEPYGELGTSNKLSLGMSF